VQIPFANLVTVWISVRLVSALGKSLGDINAVMRTELLYVAVVLYYLIRQFYNVLNRNFTRTQFSQKIGVRMSQSFNSQIITNPESYHHCRELLLLEGISLQGLGNWQAIAEHVGTRTKEEIEAHYNSVYVDSPDWPLPVR
jgi:Myb-like DNA-binding domain